LAASLADIDGVVARLCRDLLDRCRDLTHQITGLECEIAAHTADLAPTLLAIAGCGALTVWSSNRERHRLSRVGNRQLNAAVHRIAITQAHYHAEARQYLQQRRDNGDTKTESLRALKRRLSDVVYRALVTDA
jgi:hypothetical protein